MEKKKKEKKKRRDGGDCMQLHKYISIGSKLKVKSYSLVSIIHMTSLSN